MYLTHFKQRRWSSGPPRVEREGEGRLQKTQYRAALRGVRTQNISLTELDEAEALLEGGTFEVKSQACRKLLGRIKKNRQRRPSIAIKRNAEQKFVKKLNSD